MTDIAANADAKPRKTYIYRHSVLTRATHWVNVLCMTFLLMTGLQIFNAHPALYWGIRSTFDKPFLSMTAKDGANDTTQGVTTIAGISFNTTGVLGASRDENGDMAERGFPKWITLPSWQDLATGRRWHFFFAWLFVANGFLYLVNALLTRHLSRDLAPTRHELRDIPKSIWDHLRLRFPKGDEARHYNVLQKLTYLAVIVVVLPVLILAGLTMSPGVDAAFPWLLDVFGGRQSARAIHFIAASLMVLFVIVHIVMVLISGVWHNMRSMITGRYAVEEDAREI